MSTLYKHFKIDSIDYIFCSEDFEILKIPKNSDVKNAINVIKADKAIRSSDLPNELNIVPKVSKDNKIYIVGIDLTNGCNLNCTYCYISAYQKKMRLLDIKKFIDILDFLQNEKNHTIHFYFAGSGEPTINFNVLKQIPSICKEKGFNHCIFELTTNGTLLTQEIIDFLKLNKFILHVSMDGNEKLHNQTRIYHNGNGSFDAVYSSVKKLQKNKINFSCNTVIKPGNDKLLELFSFFEENKIEFAFNIATESVSGHFIPQAKELKIFEEQLSTIIKKYRHLIESNQKIYAIKLIDDIKRIHYRKVNKNGCAASKEGFHIDIDGNIYSCTYHSSSKDISVGDIYNGVDYQKIINDQWYAKPVNDYPVCKKCWMKYLCSGSCFAIKWLENKDTNIPSSYLCKTYNIYWKAIITLYVQVYPAIINGKNINFKNT